MNEQSIMEFLWHELFADDDTVWMDWATAGKIIERMRERGFWLDGADCPPERGSTWTFLNPQRNWIDGATVYDDLSPQTIAHAAALALGRKEASNENP